MPLSLTGITSCKMKLLNFYMIFLPEAPHPYADQNLLSFGAAQDVGVGHFYGGGGSKLPAITNLLRKL